MRFISGNKWILCMILEDLPPYKIYKIYKIYKTYEKNKKKYKTNRRYPSQYGFHNRAKSRQLAGDLSFWCKERWGTCIDSSTLLKTEQHLILTSLFFDTFNPHWLGPVVPNKSAVGHLMVLPRKPKRSPKFKIGFFPQFLLG